jgi:hypothetical protein
MKKKDLEKRIERLEERLHTQDYPKEVDFSILNEDDVFYVKFTDGRSAVFKGELLSKCVSSRQCIYSHTRKDYGLNEFTFDYIKSLRLATSDEKELFYKHFPKKRKFWIEVWENQDGDIWSSTFDTETELKASKKDNKELGCKTLEVIEREY